MTITPYNNQTESKKNQVAKMFDNISRRYDFLNHFLSLGIDIRWRKQTIAELKEVKPKNILDLATGTADLAIEATRLNPEKVIGIDISAGMLEVGQRKIEKKNLGNLIELHQADSENIPYPDNTFDAALVAFGVRNFENLEKGLTDIYRVLQPQGKLVVLEFSRPGFFPFKQIYNFYFSKVLPLIGRGISKDQAAYTYLPASVKAFPDGQDFIKKLEEAGFKNTKWKPLTFGISSIYTGTKLSS